MPPIGPYSQDALTRIYNVNWGTVLEQGLVADYPTVSGGPALGPPTAYALDTGERFSGVNMGASGLGYTVLTAGLICFGTPRDGEACFMAYPDYNIISNMSQDAIIKRGKLKDNGTVLEWKTAGGGRGLVALTFAGEAFHAVYCDEDTGATRIETSFDGVNWLSKPAFPAQDKFDCGGAVAFNGDVLNEDGSVKTRGSYAAAGTLEVATPEDADPIYSRSTISSLMWCTAAAPKENETAMTWTFGTVAGPDNNPGAYSGAGYTTNMASTVAGGKGTFAAAAYSKEKEIFEIPVAGSGTFRQFILQTAAAAVSSDGSKWDVVKLPGVVEGYATFSNEGDSSGVSYGTAAAFIRTSADHGYFLCAAWSSNNDKGDITNYATLHRSDDGKSWSGEIRRTDGFFFTLSAIAKDLVKTTIVHI